MKNDRGESLKGELIVQVRNTQLASCLIAVGVPLRTDPPYAQKRMVNGDRVVTWNFRDRSEDGMLMTNDLLRAWENDVEFGEKNPTHPFTYAMHSLKNYKKMVEHIKTTKPWVGYKSQTGTHTIWVIEGTAKERECIDQGLTRVDSHMTIIE